jgi:predicted alpha/beta hydrolase family esterase
MPRIEQQLQQQGIEVFRPLMPTPRIENYENFKKEFEKYESFIDEHSILVGHSCGSAFLVRWLGECDKTIKKLILVAPRKIFDDKNQEKIQQKDLYDYEINPELTKRVDEIVMFTADDEDPIGKESLQLFHQALGGNIIELPHHGHFTL